MSTLIRVVAVLAMLILIASQSLTAQTIKGKVIDSLTKEPIAGATICCGNNKCMSNAGGEFSITNVNKAKISISYIGYQTIVAETDTANPVFVLQQTSSLLQEIVLSANRDAIKRSEAPVAISCISSKQLQDTKPISVDQVLNKVSGVYMVNLGNEQHSMSIRQPMTTKGLFLYLEDGSPIRTTGLFNHNALLEMNMAAVKTIEVLKGPSSSLYGSEAIGGAVNFITHSPSATPVAKVSLQGNGIGYRRADIQTGFTKGKWGFVVNGYYAAKRNSFIDYSDFDKAIITAGLDYKFDNKTTLTNRVTLMHYYSDMTGGIDSAKFASRSFGSNYTFTYRKVNALRYRSTLSTHWNENAKTSLSLIYRDNVIMQNPAYGIKDDYRRLSNGTYTGSKILAHGEINNASFNSYAVIAQHRQDLKWKKTVLIAGASIDISPSGYFAEYIKVKKDSSTKVYTSYETRDSILTHYNNDIANYAGFVNAEFNPFSKLHVVVALRYDQFTYRFDNFLKPSSYSGSPDTVNHFRAISPKIGFTYNFSARYGMYVNYSQGFVPPQVTEMYKGIKVPELKPSVFYNYEWGGWSELLKGKLSFDWSVYYLKGTNEVISVRMDDGSTQNMNAGRTLHKGIEFGLTAKPVSSLKIRFNGAYSIHEFEQFVEKGITYSGNEMNSAPRWMYNAETWYYPGFCKGLRLGVEVQHIGNYFMDPLNTVKYKGYDIFHLRAGYKIKSTEVWINAMNITNAYYAYTSSKSSSGYNYTPGEPRHFNVGISYDFASLFTKK